MRARWGVLVPVVSVVAALVLLPTGCTSGGSAVTSGAGVVTVGGSGATAAGSTSTATGPPIAGTGSAWTASIPDLASTPAPASDTRELLLLWPFSDAAQVQAWQAAYGVTDHQAWHLDAARTALNFATQYLGYSGMDQVISQVVSGRQARIGVGWDDVGAETPGKEVGEVAPHEAAVVHLIRYGAGENAPWVAVGTDDTLLTINSPAYGATVTSPFGISGLITGVDESLRIKVLAASSRPLAQVDRLPAGGIKLPWSTRLTFTAPHGSVLTLAVSTGGHLRDVERFAVTAVRVA
jgi:hypothetical protein